MMILKMKNDMTRLNLMHNLQFTPNSIIAFEQSHALKFSRTIKQFLCVCGLKHQIAPHMHVNFLFGHTSPRSVLKSKNRCLVSALLHCAVWGTAYE